MLDKPMIDRDKTLKEERRQRRILDAARDAVRLIGPGEELGRPVRSGDQIVFPVGRAPDQHTRRAGRPREGAEMSSIYTSWFETGVI